VHRGHVAVKARAKSVNHEGHEGHEDSADLAAACGGEAV
jgi:hypothetical protein